MLTYLLILCTLGYFVLIWAAYKDYKRRYHDDRWSLFKVSYVFAVISLLSISGVLLLILGYLIITM